MNTPIARDRSRQRPVTKATMNEPQEEFIEPLPTTIEQPKPQSKAADGPIPKPKGSE